MVPSNLNECAHSKAILVVCPESNDTPLNLKDVREKKFFVVQKLHTHRYVEVQRLDYIF